MNHPQDTVSFAADWRLNGYAPPTWKTAGEVQELCFKHRKALVLWIWLVAHPDRRWGRTHVAQQLWPRLDDTQARANLRVVLHDLQTTLREMGQVDRLGVTRTEVWFEPPADWPTDPLVALRVPDQDPSQWFSGLENVLEGQWRDWLEGMRERLHQPDIPSLAAAPLSQPLAAQTLPDSLPDSVPTIGSQPLSSKEQSSPTFPDRKAVLALLRVELADVWQSQADVDLPEIDIGLMEQVCRVSRSGGAVLLHMEPDHCCLAFGVDVQQASFRWQALRTAAQLHHRLAGGAALRMGATVGQVWLRLKPDGEWMAEGRRLHLVQRLCWSAEPGELVTCDGFADLIMGWNPCQRSQVRFRGWDESYDLFHLWLSELPHPLPVLPFEIEPDVFVGRNREIKRTFDHWGCDASIVVVRGPSGMGKTRLITELQRLLQTEGHVAWVLSARPEQADRPWSLLREGIMLMLKLSQPEPAALRSRLWALGWMLSEDQYRVLEDLCVRSQVSLTAVPELVSILQRCLKPTSDGKYSVCMVDDVQWIDSASAQVLRRLMSSQPQLRWALAHMSITDTDMPPTIWPANTKPMVIPLRPLELHDAVQLLRSQPGCADWAPSVLQSRAVNTRGIPLYVLAEASGEGMKTGQLAEHFSTLLNRLGSMNWVLEVAAVWGMRFCMADVQAVTGITDLRAVLERAQGLGLLVPRGPHEWAFFHLRLREHVLATIPQQRLTRWAATVARCLQERGDLVEAASRWEQAKAWEDAKRCWMVCGFSAWERDDVYAAAHAFDQLGRLGYPEGSDGFRAQSLHIRCLWMRYGYGAPAVRSLADRLQGMLGLQARADSVFEALAIQYLLVSASDVPAGLCVAEHMQAQVFDPVSRHTAAWAMANSYFWAGDWPKSESWFAKMTELGRALRVEHRQRYFPTDPLVMGYAQWALQSWLTGRWWHALQALQAMRHHGEQSPMVQDRVIVWLFQGYAGHLRNRPGLALRCFEQAQSLALTEDYPFWVDWCTMFVHLPEGAQPIDTGAEQWIDSHTRIVQGYGCAAPWFAVLMAEIACRQHQWQHAIRWCEMALGETNPSAQGFARAEAWMLRAWAHQAMGRDQQAQSDRLQGLRLAHQQGMRRWLVRLLRDPVSSKF